MDASQSSAYDSRRFMLDEESISELDDPFVTIDTMYDDVITKAGGFACYQKLATLIVIFSYGLYYVQFWSLNLLLLEPNLECL